MNIKCNCIKIMIIFLPAAGAIYILSHTVQLFRIWIFSLFLRSEQTCATKVQSSHLFRSFFDGIVHHKIYFKWKTLICKRRDNEWQQTFSNNSRTIVFHIMNHFATVIMRTLNCKLCCDDFVSILSHMPQLSTEPECMRFIKTWNIDNNNNCSILSIFSQIVSMVLHIFLRFGFKFTFIVIITAEVKILKPQKSE